MDETEKIEAVMMCWENSECSLVKEPYNETVNQEERAETKDMQKQKDEEEHVDSTLHTGKRLIFLIKEFSW